MRAKRLLRDECGAAAVEFALVLPVVCLLLFGIIEFGRAWNVKQVLTDAAREGARVAVVNNNMDKAQLADSVNVTVRRAASRASLDTTSTMLKITQIGVGGNVNSAATVGVEYAYVPLFGTWVIEASSLPIRTSFVMRNE